MIKNGESIIIENEIERYMLEYADLKGFDLDEMSQSKWSACMGYIYKALFRDTDIIKPSQTQVNYDVVERIMSEYIDLCLEYDKEISCFGFCRLTGLDENTVVNWGKSENRQAKKIHDTLIRTREESLSNKLITNKSGHIGIIAILNHKYNWNAPQTPTEALQPKQKRISREDLKLLPDGNNTDIPLPPQ